MKAKEIMMLAQNLGVELDQCCDYLAIVNYFLVTTEPNVTFDLQDYDDTAFKDTPQLYNSLSKLKNETKESVNQLVEYVRHHAFNIEDNFSALRYFSGNKKYLKENGIVYTPKWLADKVTTTTFQQWVRLHRTGRKIESIADLSCGTGVFLSSLKRNLIKDAEIYGQDIDAKSVEYSRLICRANNITAKLRVCDTLLQQNNTKYDILIGNPPYVRSQNLDKVYSHSLQQKFGDVLQGNFDLVVAFLDHATSHLSEGGLASYIVSSRFIHSKYGKVICDKISKNFRLINVTDFGDSQLFPGNVTYTAVITFAKLPPAKKLTITYFPFGLNKKEDINNSETFCLQAQSLESFPWNLKNKVSQKVMSILDSSANPKVLDVFDNISQSLRTGANNTYISSDYSDFESELLIRPILGEDIKAYSPKKINNKLIFPYELIDGRYHTIPEEKLRIIAPNIYKHLVNERAMLDLRKQDQSSTWYAYSRHQNLKTIDKSKVLIKEMMPTTQIAFTSKRCAMLSGYALTSEKLPDDHLKTWVAILNTPIMEYSLRHYGSQMHSGWFRLMKYQLENVRLPRLSDSQWKKAHKISMQISTGNLAELNVLNDLVAEAFGLTRDDMHFIDTYLATKHVTSIPNYVKKNQVESEVNYEPVKLNEYSKLHHQAFELRKAVTFQLSKNEPIHGWFPYTQGYSQALVDYLIDRMEIKQGHKILDPFVGVGTTLLAAKRRGLDSDGVDVSPLVTWISNTKLNAFKLTKKEVEDIEAFVSTLPPLDEKLGVSFDNNNTFQSFMEKAFSPRIRYQVGLTGKLINNSLFNKTQKDFLKLALVSILEKVSQMRKHGSHYRFMLNGSSVGLQKLNIQIIDPASDLRPHITAQVNKMLADLRLVGKDYKNSAKSSVMLGDIREIVLKKNYYDAVITSPPYLNRNNYIAQQKTELGVLNMVADQVDYKKLVKQTLRSHTDADLNPATINTHPLVTEIINKIQLNEGNNKLIPIMIAGYFHDMEQIINKISKSLKIGGKAALVVGNSRWGGIVIPVDHMLAKIGEEHGLKAVDIIVTRLKGNSPQQMKQYGRIPVRESILVLKKQG